MAIQATSQWWIRTDGDDDNGGGFDSGISGAGTNYSDQATAQLDLTDLATASAGSTTLTSVTGGFTSAMIGNCIKLRSGTNATAGYYFITGFTDINTVTIDRSCDNGVGGLSVGSGKLGGAFLDMRSVLSLNASPVASPLGAGHQINVRGSGTVDPVSVDYTMPVSYLQFVNGNQTDGYIKVVGYNGTPNILSPTSAGGRIFYASSFMEFENLKLTCNAGGSSMIDCFGGRYIFIKR